MSSAPAALGTPPSRGSCRCVPRASTRRRRSSSAPGERRSGSPHAARAAASRMRARARSAPPRRHGSRARAMSAGSARNAALLAPFGGRYIARKCGRQRRDPRRLARDVRVRRHRHRQRAVEAQHELVGRVIVREEAGHVDPVHLVRARARIDRLRVKRIGARTNDPEQPRAVAEHVPQRSGRLGALRTDDPRRERIGHDEVPVAAEPRLGQRAVGRLAVDQPGGNEQRAVAEPPLRHAIARRRPPSSCSASSRQRRASSTLPVSAHTRPIARSPCHAVAWECRPSTGSWMSDE